MVLAAGLGTRLRPLTDRVPKPLVPLLNRPLVERPLERLRGAGIHEVVLNVHHQASAVRTALGDGRGLGLQIEYSVETDLLGTGGGVARVRALGLLGEGTFVLMNGDSVVEVDLRAVIDAHRASGALATIVLHPRTEARFHAVE